MLDGSRRTERRPVRPGTPAAGATGRHDHRSDVRGVFGAVYVEHTVLLEPPATIVLLLALVITRALGTGEGIGTAHYVAAGLLLGLSPALKIWGVLAVLVVASALAWRRGLRRGVTVLLERGRVLHGRLLAVLSRRTRCHVADGGGGPGRATPRRLRRLSNGSTTSLGLSLWTSATPAAPGHGADGRSGAGRTGRLRGEPSCGCSRRC